MKKLKCIKELDALYDFRYWIQKEIDSGINYGRDISRLEESLIVLDYYIDKMYPPIKKEK